MTMDFSAVNCFGWQVSCRNTSGKTALPSTKVHGVIGAMQSCLIISRRMTSLPLLSKLSGVPSSFCLLYFAANLCVKNRI